MIFRNGMRIKNTIIRNKNMDEVLTKHLTSNQAALPRYLL